MDPDFRSPAPMDPDFRSPAFLRRWQPQVTQLTQRTLPQPPAPTDPENRSPQPQ